MPLPSKKSSGCKLNMLPDMSQGRTDVKTVSLFEQKRIRGFWPCYNDETGTRELTVRSRITLHHGRCVLYISSGSIKLAVYKNVSCSLSIVVFRL